MSWAAFPFFLFSETVWIGWRLFAGFVEFAIKALLAVICLFGRCLTADSVSVMVYVYLDYLYHLYFSRHCLFCLSSYLLASGCL